MADVSIAILGLSRIGTSMAMALKRYNERNNSKHHFNIVGYDNRPPVQKAAQKLKVIDKMERNAYNAVRDQDIVVVALPFNESEGLYELVSSDLRPGVVVLDTTPLKQPALKYAKQFLPEESHLVGISPILNPKYLFSGVDEIEHAHEDLFDEGAILLSPGVSCASEAVELASDFALILGATPRFVDPAESDALTTATEAVPALLGIAYFSMMAQSTAWGDSQRQTNTAFSFLTHHLFDAHPDDLRDTWLETREGLIRYTDDLITTLRDLRTVLAENDRDALEAALVNAATEYEGWINRRHKNQWDENKKSESPGLGGFTSSMFGSIVGGRLFGGKNDKEE